MNKQDEGDFVSKKISYMIQAIQGALPKEVIKGFGKYKTDTDRFSSAWKLPEVHDVLILEKEFEEKSAKQAKVHRERGNEYFQRKSYLTALGEYSRGVLKAPSSIGHEKEKTDSGCKNISNGVEELNIAKMSGQEDSKAKKDLVQGVPSSQEEKGQEGNMGEGPNTGQDGNIGNVGIKGQEENKGQGDKKDQEENCGADKDCKTSTEDEKPKNELALAFANRSAALFHLKRYRECLEDIQFAIESGYPEASCHKLYDRQGSCYIELGNPTEAEASFTLAQNSLAAANLDEKTHKSWLRALTKQLGRCKQIVAKPYSGSGVKSERTIPPCITGEASATHLNASAKVRVLYNNVAGRHIVAGQDIKIGDVLVVDRPFATVLFPCFYKTHCYHCFAQVSVPIPCLQCCTIVFCSRQCRDASWTKFHQYECQFFALLDTSTCAKIGHLAIRLLMVLGLSHALEYLKRREEQVSPSPELVGINGDGIYCSDYDSIYDMATHSDHRPSDQLFDFSIVSCLLMKVLQLSGYVQLAEDSHDFALLGGLLLRHLQIIQCNALRVIELQRPGRFDDLKPGELGIGLYPTAALVNHSCDPSADLNFYGDSVVVRAIRNINQDEEVAISYGPLFYESKAGPRQTQLKGAYFFSCRCLACREQWPVIEEMFEESPIYRCGNCRAILRSEDKFERKFFVCSKCQNKQDMEDVVSQLQASYDVFARAMNDAMSGRSQDALPNFVQHLLLLQRYIRQPWRDFCACQSAIKQCYRLQANTKS